MSQIRIIVFNMGSLYPFLGFRSRREGGGGATRWVWCHFNNSAHPSHGKIHLHHWHRLDDAVVREKSEDVAIIDRSDQKQETKKTQRNVKPEDFSQQCSEPTSCCRYTASSDYAPASFNKKAQVVRYSSTFYTKHLAVSRFAILSFLHMTATLDRSVFGLFVFPWSQFFAFRCSLCLQGGPRGKPIIYSISARSSTCGLQSSMTGICQ